MDTPPSDAARLLRVLAARALVLMFAAGVLGEAAWALVLALAGLGLLLTPVGAAPGCRREPAR